MVPRLPVPGSDAGNWGEILNDFLEQSHNPDGSLKNVATPADIVAKADQSAVDDLADNLALKASIADLDNLKSELQSAIDAKADQVLEYATPLLMLSPRLSRDRIGLVSPTKTGAVWDVTLDGTSAWRVLEGTINYWADPYSQSLGGSPLNATRVINAVDGLTRMTQSANGYWGMYGGNESRPNATAGEVWTISLEMRSPDASASHSSIAFEWRDASNVNLIGSATGNLALTTSWQYFTFTATAPVNTANFIPSFYNRVQVSGSDRIIEYRNIQVEKKSYATPLCPAKDSVGNLIAGQVWQGAPNASTSTRTEGIITYPSSRLPSTMSGAVYIRTRMPTYRLVSKRHLFDFGAYAGLSDRQELFARIDVAGQVTTYSKSGSAGYQSFVDTYSEGLPMSYYLGWDAAKIMGRTGQMTRNVPAQSSWPTTPAGISGRRLSSAEIWPEPIFVYLWFERPLTATELARLDTTPTYRLGWDSLNPALMSTPFADLVSNRKAVSTTILRLTPGPSGIEVTTLSSGYALHDTGQRLAVSSVIYALVWTMYGQGWIEESKLGAL